MEFKDPRRRKVIQPEVTEVTDPLVILMRAKGWWIKKIHGSAFQSGLPDIYAFHPEYRQRWIELKHASRKREANGGLSERQIKSFTQMSTFGIGIWILTSHLDYDLLFKPPNWKEYLAFKGLR